MLPHEFYKYLSANYDINFKYFVTVDRRSTHYSVKCSTFVFTYCAYIQYTVLLNARIVVLHIKMFSIFKKRKLTQENLDVDDQAYLVRRLYLKMPLL